MRFSIPRIAAITTLLTTSMLAYGHELDGAWERVSLTNTRTGESPEALNRQGLMIFGHGHYAMMTQNPDRRALSRDELAALSPDEELEYRREWLDINAHSGRFETDGDRLTWYRNLSEDPREVGTVSNLNYEVDGDRLLIWFTLPNGDRYDWVWRRAGQ